MQYKIIYHPEALGEIESALKWYDEKRKGLSGELLIRLYGTLDTILLNPLLFNKVFKDFRKANLRIFPYSIIYRIENEKIVTLAFHHQKRHPKHWKKRKMNTE